MCYTDSRIFIVTQRQKEPIIKKIVNAFLDKALLESENFKNDFVFIPEVEIFKKSLQKCCLSNCQYRSLKDFSGCSYFYRDKLPEDIRAIIEA